MIREDAIKELTELLPEEFLMEYIDAIKMAIEALEKQHCEDCIRRQDLREPRFIIAENDYQKGWNDALESVYENAPSIQPQPKMGRWIYNEKEDSYRCSLCTFPCHKDNLGAIPTMYCANCGSYNGGDENADSD